MAKYANLSADEIRGHRMLVFRRTVAYIVLILVCIICIFPFVMLLVNTTKDTSTLKTTFSLLPGGDFQTRPLRPFPATCISATNKVP